MDKLLNDYYKELIQKPKNIFAKQPALYHHVSNRPWLCGALGNFFSGIIFITENHSLTQVEKAQGRRALTATSDAHAAPCPIQGESAIPLAAKVLLETVLQVLERN
jgi:hypothetical protein